MILLADIGNSRVKWATYDGEESRPSAWLRSDRAESVELACVQWQGLPRPDRVLIVSVAGLEARSALSGWIERAWGIKVEFVVSTAAACGVQNAYAEPERLGADRWVALIAARSLTQQACYVADCGTALTIDALAADGRHLGGVIVPGIQLMRQALYRETRQIPPEQGEPRLFGQSTRDCVWGGALYAVVAAIDGLTERMMAAGGPGIRFLTGGGAEAVSPYLLGEYRLEPNLLFDGLRVIAKQNPDRQN